MAQNFGIEEVCIKTFACSYSGVRSIEHTLKSQLSKCYIRQMKSLSFSFVSLLTLLFLLSLLLYRYDEECSEAVPNYLRVKSVSNFVTITRWSVPRKNRNTLSGRENCMLLIFCVV